MNRRDFLSATAAAGAVTLVPALPAFATAGPVEKATMSVLGSDMAYVDRGEGRPVVFLHGNPTSSYLWRNIIPYVTDAHRAIAPDMIGMGDSDKPDIGYTYQVHADYLFGLLDALELQDAVLVVHDWGSALGFHYARTRPERVAAVAFMEALVPPVLPFPSYEAMGPFEEMFRNFRTPGIGEAMILEQNFFIDQLLGQAMVATPLSDQVLAEYNRYYPTAESRLPALQWPREIPIGGEPAGSTAAVVANNAWLLESEIPKLLLYAEPGAIIPPQAAEWLAANVPNLEMHFVGVGVHFIQEDQPDAIGAKLAEWLLRV
ncbi:MAG: haloalkane dehalogenase [Rhodobacter sp.]|nr:haloalkane dehalogenase [Rhodobacter sp.]